MSLPDDIAKALANEKPAKSCSVHGRQLIQVMQPLQALQLLQPLQLRQMGRTILQPLAQNPASECYSPAPVRRLSTILFHHRMQLSKFISTDPMQISTGYGIMIQQKRSVLRPLLFLQEYTNECYTPLEPATC